MEIKDVENLAELARLELSEEEKKSMLKDLSSILEYVKIIENASLNDLHPDLTVHNVWREDTFTPPQFSLKLITEQFPDSQDGFLKVKKIL